MANNNSFPNPSLMANDNSFPNPSPMPNNNSFPNSSLMASNNFNVSSSTLHETNLVLSLNSSLAQNHVNFNSQSLAPTINGVRPSNVFVPQIGPTANNLGQLALSQKLTEIRKIHVTPQGVRIHTVIEHSSIFAQTQFQALPPNQPMINLMNLDDLGHGNSNDDRVVLNPEPVSVCVPGIFMAQNPHDHSLNLGQNQNPETNQLDTDQVTISKDQVRVPNNQINISSESSDDLQEMDLGDGRTHSLPHQKYGPYTCPNCNRVFTSSQAFAAHASKYYKGESREQRKRRLAARYKKKNLRRVHSRGNGLPILPVTGNSVPLNVNVRRKKVAGGKVQMAGKRVVEDKVREEGQGNTTPDEASGSSPPGMVNKEESL